MQLGRMSVMKWMVDVCMNMIFDIIVIVDDDDDDDNELIVMHYDDSTSRKR